MANVQNFSAYSQVIQKNNYKNFYTLTLTRSVYLDFRQIRFNSE